MKSVGKEANKKRSDKRKDSRVAPRLVVTEATPDNMALGWLYWPKVNGQW